jgi:DNA-binding transcriptional MerR regulator
VDTREAAAKLGTDPRTLRRFLRSPMSTFQAVGSGARYEFTDRDLTTLRKRFEDWANTSTPAVVDEPVVPGDAASQDEIIWAEEGPVTFADIRDPRIRHEVRRIAREQEARLHERLMACGLHITQRAS